ncbi:MAG: diaminopimelate decarboxylase [Deltaproteobacteria bacterium]|nr:diaminopimelate decarboxylase [Deltaproteobacteria bacterium]
MSNFDDKNIDYKNSVLHVEGVELNKIAAEAGTPTYVYSNEIFAENIINIDQALRGAAHLVCYSVKVASNVGLLKKAAGLGAGADIVSGGELYRCRKAGIDPKKIVYSGVGKAAHEMAEALDAGILMFNVESAQELSLLAQVASDKGKVAQIAVRVNPDVDPQTHPYVATGLKESKFGVPAAEAMELYRIAKNTPSLKAIGLDCHIGSQLVSVAPFVAACERLKRLFLDLRSQGINLTYIDLGGGLGIRYNQEKPPTAKEYGEAVLNVLGDIDDLFLIVEPGRSVAGSAAVLLIKVLYNKRTDFKHFVVTDGAMNDLIRPCLYGSYHQIKTVNEKNQAPLTVDVVGPVCESGDFLAKDRPLAPVEPGEYLAVLNAGAYGMTMSSNYNSRTRPAEVLVEGDSFKLIKQRETYDNLILGEIF